MESKDLVLDNRRDQACSSGIVAESGVIGCSPSMVGAVEDGEGGVRATIVSL